MAVTKVVDASALAALVFGEPESKDVASRLEDGILFAPDLLPYEMANICVMKMRRRPHEAAALRSAFRNFQELPIELRIVDTGSVLDLAVQKGLTAYDAAYFWLALELGAELVSLDKQLLRAAGQST